MMNRMKVDKMSISMSPELGDGVRLAAEREGLSVSAWLAEAAAARLRSQALATLLAEWQSKHGKITPRELAKARVELGYARRDRKSA